MPSRSVILYSNPKQLYYIGGGVIGLVLLILLVRGLSPNPTTTNKNLGSVKTVEDPWPLASKDLERETDIGTCRRVLDQVTSVLASNPSFTTPPGLSAAEEKTLRELFPGFGDEDARELHSTAFTRLDPYHLEECFYFRDAAKSLDVADFPPVEQANRAFAFVCRQVYLNWWLMPIGEGRVQPMPPVPPAYVLRRGWGTGLERALVFLALLRQLGLDGCLIGPEGAEGKPGLYAPPEKAGILAALKGPFWAVGVRVGSEIHLYEPWRGKPFPGPDGKGVCTLSQCKSNPKLVDDWTNDKANPWDVSPADLQAGEVYLAVSLSTLAPRMRFLEEKLTNASAVNVFDDPTAIRDRFVKEKATGQPPKWWSPKPTVDPFDALHSLVSFLPIDEGGRDSTNGKPSQLALYQNSLLPTSLFTRAPELTSGEATEVLIGYMRGLYLALYLTPPTPLERIQRGNYFDVSTYLTEKERGFSQAVQRFRAQDLPVKVKQYATELDELYGKLQRARAVRDVGAEATIRTEIEARWAMRDYSGILIERGLAEPSEAEATYLLALCKHEAAERASIRAERAASAVRAAVADPKADPEKLKVIRKQVASARVSALSAWKEAQTWWLQYNTVKLAQQMAFPGRGAHTSRLTAEAADRVAGF